MCAFGFVLRTHSKAGFAFEAVKRTPEVTRPSHSAHTRLGTSAMGGEQIDSKSDCITQNANRDFMLAMIEIEYSWRLYLAINKRLNARFVDI